MSQRDLVCDEEMDDGEYDQQPWDGTPGGLSMETPKRLPGQKAPRAEWNQYAPQGSYEEEDTLEQPDLHEYFSQWEIPDKQVILLCRSYASYLAAKGHAKAK